MFQLQRNSKDSDQAGSATGACRSTDRLVQNPNQPRLLSNSYISWHVDDWTESEGTSSPEDCEHNVENLALEVIGQNWSGEMVSLFLEDWGTCEGSVELPLALDLCVPGNVRGVHGEPTATV